MIRSASGQAKPPQGTSSVQLNGLPPGITAAKLTACFKPKSGQFTVLTHDKQHDKSAWCAYLNGLTDAEAEEFAKQWHGYNMQPTCKIMCKVCSKNKPVDQKKVAPSQTVANQAFIPSNDVRNFSVQLTGLPSGITSDFLASCFKQSIGTFLVLHASKQKSSSHWCAYLNGLTENEADMFQNRWNNFVMSNSQRQIVCTKLRSKTGPAEKNEKRAPRADSQRKITSPTGQTAVTTAQQRGKVTRKKDEYLPHEGSSLATQYKNLDEASTSSTSSVCTLQSENADDSKTAGIVLCKFNILGNCRFGEKCNRVHYNCPIDNDCQDNECCLGHTSGVKARFPKGIDWRKLLLCNKYRSAACTFENCAFQHIDCSEYDECEDSTCPFGHPPAWVIDLADSNECSVDCYQYDCKKRHPQSRIGPCNFGDRCFKTECSFLHSDRRQLCDMANDCEDFECPRLHPPSRKKLCDDGIRCRKFHCELLHPVGRQLCEIGKTCCKFECEKLHPPGRTRKCKFGKNCRLQFCPFIHPPDRQTCEKGALCDDIACTAVHPLGRSKPCKFKENCWNPECEHLHPDDWNPCPNKDCRIFDCSLKHSPRRPQPCHLGISCEDRNCNNLHPEMCRIPHSYRAQRNQLLKTDHQRKIDREANKLPVLDYREEFITRLEKEKVLIVRAETGSGKTTQLPQYAAEYFGGLVICTQPRVMAAVSIAHRVADEFDGCDVGESVGYKVGGEDGVIGSDIMFVTEASLIRYSQDNNTLDNVSVLIVDEAHERSLNVDIVLGLAKLIRAKRLENFHVVIASATIDPKQFQQFFKCNVLDIPGRNFDVSLQYVPPLGNDNAEKFIKAHLVPTLCESLETYSEGFALVFLPGEREIQQAIEAFEKQKSSDGWVALPLYGSLPKEEQIKVLNFESNQEGDRLVAFCTNVAETSLTIKGVRLVVDSGLAKEARFDAKRRITVLEMKQISLSSANQRKGRAGRTAPGHCVRLYAQDTLNSAVFVPEILRSSLDLVILQLIKMKLEPLNFPFLDKPDQNLLIYSYQTLKELDCLGANSTTLSRAGELFAELGLDPRLSAFATRAHQKFGQLEMAITIACILTAPGSLFYLGKDKAKKEALSKRALDVFKYESDILYELSVFNSWMSRGEKRNGRCADCNKVLKRFQETCRVCRVKHSNANMLNNKVLEHIEKSRASFIKMIKKSRWFAECAATDKCEDGVETISICLEEVLAEQVVCLLVKELPSEGVKVVSSGIRAQISNTSVFAQRAQNFQYFVALRVKQMISGMYIVDGLHPIKEPKSVSNRRSHPLQKLLTEPNTSVNLLKKLKSAIHDDSSKIPAEQRSWIVLSHNPDEATIDVYARRSDMAALTPMLKGMLEDIRKKFLDEKFDFTIPDVCKATFTSGLLVQNFEELKSSSSTKTTKSSAIVGDEEKTTRRGLTQLLISAPCGFTEQQIRLRSKEIESVKHLNAKKADSRLFTFRIGNLPADFQEKGIENWINEVMPLERVNIKIFSPHESGLGSFNAKISVKSNEERENLIEYFQNWFSSIGPHKINIRSKSTGKIFAKNVTPNIQVRDDKFVDEKFLVCFASNESARMFQSMSESSASVSSIEWSESVFVSHSKLFENVEDLIDRSCGNSVKHTEVWRADGTVQIRLTSSDHDECFLAAQKLRSLFSPTTIHYTTSKEKAFFYEINKKGLFNGWIKELGLHCEFRDDFKFRVFGPKVKQGRLMRNIADEVAKIEQEHRYQVIPLDAATAQLFKFNLAGGTKLKELQDKWTDKCFIKFLFYSSEIEIFARQDASAIQKCQKEISDIIQDLGSKKEFNAKACEFCSSHAATETFFICGHRYCKCLQYKLEKVVATPICCPKCQTPVLINEIRKSVNDFDKLCRQLIDLHVSKNANIAIASCIVQDCDGFVSKNSYRTCRCCKHDVCVSCKVVDDRLHKDRTCAEFNKSVSTINGQLSQLLKDAEIFVRQNWPADMPKIIDIDFNPGVLSDPLCPAVKSFLGGLQKLNRSTVHASDGKFAYHGSHAEALKQICHGGFDPDKRSGQACGPGEYFGETPSISNGYSRGCGAMIVAFLLNGGPITHRAGFCYVVNNPRDGSVSFNLPLLVVYFNQTTPRLDFIKPGPTQVRSAGATFPASSKQSSWTPPFRWHWRKDDGSFEPYTDDINSLLETHYDRFKMNNGPCEFTTPPITRYVDDIPRCYIVNFSANTQKNSNTGYQRQLQRSAVDSVSLSCTWEYVNDVGVWQPFESLVQLKIQQAYQAYIQGNGSCSVTVQFPGRVEAYQLDFLAGCQTNTQSGKKRQIRKN